MPQNPQKELYPLNLLLSKLYPKVIDQLPAGPHRLRYCFKSRNKEGASPYVE